MDGIVDLRELLASLSPGLSAGEYAFCRVAGALGDHAALDPVVSVRESEGLTLVLPVAVAVRESLSYTGVYRRITLAVHSSLQAVGLTATVASALAAHEIPANVVAGYHHDHIFVPGDQAEQALEILQGLAGDGR